LVLSTPTLMMHGIEPCLSPDDGHNDVRNMLS